LGKGQPSKEGQRTPVDKGVQGRCHRVECRKGRVMREARTILQLLRERGKKRLPLERVYRLLFNPNLYLMAYGKIYRNHGAMTKGTTQETADGMSQDKIATIIDAVRHERYRWKPARRIYIPKKDGATRILQTVTTRGTRSGVFHLKTLTTDLLTLGAIPNQPNERLI